MSIHQIYSCPVLLICLSAHRNKSLICLPMDTPGIHLAKKIDKMGMRCSDTAVVFFDDVRIPAKNIIGDEGN